MRKCTSRLVWENAAAILCPPWAQAGRESRHIWRIRGSWAANEGFLPKLGEHGENRRLTGGGCSLARTFLSLETTKARHAGNDPNVERHDPDLWTDEFYFLNQPGQADIQSDLFYDYRTNVDAYPKWQAWMREKQPHLLVIWGKYESSFDPSEPEAYRRDVPKAEVHIVDGGHFALGTAADEIAALVNDFVSSLQSSKTHNRGVAAQH